MLKLLGGIMAARWLAGVLAVTVTGGIIYLVVRRVAGSQDVPG